MLSLSKFQTKIAPSLPDEVNNLDYLVPMVVGMWGHVACTPASAKAASSTPSETMELLASSYRDLATTTAHLLALYGVDAVGGDAIATVTNKLSALVDPLVSIGTRVDRLYRAYRMDELERVRHEAELLWVALEYRCDRITGQSFNKVIN